MRELTELEYQEFVRNHREVIIEGTPVKLISGGTIELQEPQDFKLEKTTVWSFENRGRWATHKGDYRGNWAPEVPRNLILRYSNPGDVVLDQMVGSGTTLIECKLLSRNGIGVDINPDALMVARNRLDFTHTRENNTFQKLYIGDARQLDLIPNGHVDFVATHPPYANIIPFTKQNKIEGDISQVHSIDEFIAATREISKESFRVLKPGKHCAILIGDTHKHKHFVPISFRVLEVFLDVGFILREHIIKRQWHTQTMRGRWKENYNHDFLLTAHENLFVFRKLGAEEKLSKFKNSIKWW